jgi:hypothetical protein
MRAVNEAEAEFIPEQPHRPGGVSFRHLLAGDDGAPDNYSLTLVSVAERYEAVRHRHNFEQVRVVLEGRFGYGPALEQQAGTVGYFCEGTYYTQLGEGPSLTLLLQVGGASGSGYMGFHRLRRGIAELQARGDGAFRDGVYTRVLADGRRVNQDGYEAVWEQVNGRTLVYPQPRYAAPVILHPEHFGWVPVAGARGVAVRRLGCFNERGLGVAMWRLAPGAQLALQPAGRRELMVVHDGELRPAGLPPLAARGALEVLRGERLDARAGAAGALLYGFSLPVFGTG